MFSMECVGISHIGNKRKRNEDKFYLSDGVLSQGETECIQLRNYKSCKDRVFAISDGMGGHCNGHIASQIVLEKLGHYEQAYCKKSSVNKKDKFKAIEGLQEYVKTTNQEVLIYEPVDKPQNMGATLTGILCFQDEATVFNIGDSSVYFSNEKGITKLTKEDNERGRLTKYFGLLEEHGLLTAHISQPIPLENDMCFFICSDGVTDEIQEETIQHMIQEGKNDLKKAASNLLGVILDGEGRDNITFVLIRFKRKEKWGIHRFLKYGGR